MGGYSAKGSKYPSLIVSSKNSGALKVLLQKNKGGTQTAFDTAASAFKTKVVITTHKRKKN